MIKKQNIFSGFLLVLTLTLLASSQVSAGCNEDTVPTKCTTPDGREGTKECGPDGRMTKCFAEPEDPPVGSSSREETDDLTEDSNSECSMDVVHSNGWWIFEKFYSPVTYTKDDSLKTINKKHMRRISNTGNLNIKIFYYTANGDKTYTLKKNIRNKKLSGDLTKFECMLEYQLKEGELCEDPHDQNGVECAKDLVCAFPRDGRVSSSDEPLHRLPECRKKSTATYTNGSWVAPL